MPGRTYPSFATSLLAVIAGSALTAWLVAVLHGAVPSLSPQVWSIAACVVAAIAVKAVLRTFGYDGPFFAAAGALLTQRVVGYALVGAASSSISPFPVVLPPALLASAPGLLVAAMVVQFTASRQHATSRR
jgi:hypothetical protein